MKLTICATGSHRKSPRPSATDERIRRATAAALTAEALEARVFLSATESPAEAMTSAGMLGSLIATGEISYPYATTTAKSAAPASIPAASAAHPMVGAAAPATTRAAAPARAASGLLAQYFSSSDYSGTPVDRIDKTVNFNWGRIAPIGKIRGGSFAVKWTGELVAPATGTFTFSLTSVGTAHLTVNGADVLDASGAAAGKAATNAGTADLVAGQSYAVELDYVASTRAMASLKWSGPRVARQVIPPRDLVSDVTPPDAPSGLAAQVASPTEVDLSWQADGSSITAYKVQRSLDGGVHFATIATVGGSVTGYQDARVRPNKSYTYRLIAQDLAGASSPSAPLKLKTLPNGVTPINASADVSAGSAVFLSWAPPDAAAGLTGYSIARSDDGGKTWSALATVDANTNIYTDASAADGQAYTYLITGMSGSAATPYVGTTSVAIPLAAPSGLTATVTDSAHVLLQWANHSTSATGVEIDQSANGGLTWSTLATLPAGATSYTAAIVAAQNYAYQARATMGAATASAFSNVAAIAATLGTPANISATVNSPNSITIAWTPIGSGQTGYEIDRSPDGGATWPTTFYTTTTATRYTDTTALGAAGYTYRVRALAGTTASSPYSATASATTALAAPGNVAATALTASAVMLNWAETNAGETGYEIDRSPDGSSNWAALATVPPGTTSYTDPNLSFSTTYYYRVTAHGPSNATAASPVISATTAASDAPQYLLTPSTLATLRQEAANNTPQWQAFKAGLDAGLNQVTSVQWQAFQLPLAENYALGYQILKDSDPTTAAGYADKAIAIMLTGLQDDNKDSWGSGMFLARGDGSTTSFTLPTAGLIPGTLSVYSSVVQTYPVTKGGPNGQDPVAFYAKFLKVSNTSDGSADFTQGVDWQYNPNYQQNELDWSLGSGNQPATGSTYYVTVAPEIGESVISSGYTLSGNTITFNTAPPASEAIFVQYEYNSPTLKYQQVGDGRGGFNNVLIDDGYTSRNLQCIPIALDWLWSYQGMTAQVRSQTTSMLVQWSDYLRDNGYYGDTPSSNYGAGHLAFRMATAIALQNRDTTDAARLMAEMQSYQTTYLLPILTAPNPANTNSNGGALGTDQGGFWAEGWNYGAFAIQNVLTSEIAFQDAGWGSASAAESWANDVIVSLLEGQPTQSTLYDGGDGYAYPEPFISSDALATITYAATDTTIKSYGNWAIQNYYSGAYPADAQDLLFRNPSAPASFWGGAGGLPLQYLSPGTGLGVARENWNYDSTWLAFHSGNLAVADHQDLNQGNLTIDNGADSLLVDVAAYTGDQYPQDKSTYGNAVLIDDGGAGLQTYRFAQGQWYGTPGVTMPHFEGTADYAYMQGNYAAAYTQAFGGSGSPNPASELVRDVFYIRGTNYIVTYDRATTTQASFMKRLQWNFASAPSISGNSWVATAGSSKLFGQTYSDAPIATGLQAVNVNGTTIQEVQTQNTSATATVDYVTAMQVASSGVAAMDTSTHVESADSKLEGVRMGNYVVLFGKNGAVSGGTSYSITAGAGQSVTHYLSDMTPGQTYTLSGAVQGTATADAQGVVTFTTTGTGAAQTVTLS